MKKTIITLFALASVTTAEVAPSSVWSYDNYDLTQYGKIDLTTLDLSTAKGKAGYTLMITFSENISWSDAGSILWLSSVGANESGNYTNSTGTLGIKFGGNGTGLAIFNAANGSSETNKVEWNGLSGEQKNYTFSGLTVFMTAQAVTTGEGDEEVTKGVVTLYQASENGTLTLLSQNDGLVCADVKSMWLGNW
ncbi:MAG: hypothetical protein IJ993_10540, partial [Akkermansia sp.]|nr:hypothetical protein [Akkermansia sp.]